MASRKHYETLNDTAIQHFQQMSELATMLRPVPAQILSHSYADESFGYWAMDVRRKGYRLKLMGDPRERAVRMMLSAHRDDYNYSAVVWEGPLAYDGVGIARATLEALVQAVADFKPY